MEKPQLSRRRFLLTLGAGSAGAAAAALARHATAAPTAEPASEKPKKPGYAVSEHIENYYRTTRM